MLIRTRILTEIAAGRVRLAFRRWRRPTVVAGGTLRTTVGVLSIVGVRKTSEARITEADVQAAGFPSRAALLADLRPEGDLFRIELRFAGADPRVALREESTLTREARAAIARRLERIPGARRMLAWIAAHPGAAAARLARHLKREVPRLKADVRKLKDLGLTESLSPRPGHRLSKRGAAFLRGRVSD